MYLERVQQADTLNEIHDLLSANLVKLDVHRFYYICVSPHSLFDKARVKIFQRGYDHIPGFIQDFEAYLNSEEALLYFKFQEIGNRRAHYAKTSKPDESLKNLYALLYKYKNHLNLDHAFAVPVYGAKAHHGIFHMPAKEEADTPQRRSLFEFLCQTAHRRTMEMNLQPQNSIKLSIREKDVLAALIKGKKNSLIAKELDISHHTVDAYIRRIFTKLDVNDRVTAAIKGTNLFLLADDIDVTDFNSFDESNLDADSA